MLAMDVLQRATARETLKFLNAADAYDLLAVIADPDRNRISPVPVAREAPIASVLKPIMEALLLDKGWNPAGRLVELNKPLLDLSDFDEPAVEATIDKRCLTSPAEGIAMDNGTASKESPGCLQIGNYHLVSILDVHAGIWLDNR